MTAFDKAWALLKMIDPTDPMYGEMMAKNMLIDAWNLDFNENNPEGQQQLHDNIHSWPTEKFLKTLHSHANDNRRGCSGSPCVCDLKDPSTPEGMCVWDYPSNSVFRGHQRNMLILDNWNKWKEDASHVWPQLGGYREQ